MTKRIFFLLFAIGTLSGGQKFNVKIISREDNASTYGFVVPGYSQTNTNANVNCTTYPNAVGCNGSATSNTTTQPAVVGSYQVSGATLALQLPDGRVAVVNCDSKTNWTEWTMRSRRSCRIPMLDEVGADFSGDRATLRWAVSIDGRKLQQETYKVVAVIPAKNPPPAPADKWPPQTKETGATAAFRGVDTIGRTVSVYIGSFGPSQVAAVARERVVSQLVTTGAPLLLVTDVAEADAVLTALPLDEPGIMAVRLTGRGGRILWAGEASQGDNPSESAGIASDIISKLTRAIEQARR